MTGAFKRKETTRTGQSIVFRLGAETGVTQARNTKACWRPSPGRQERGLAHSSVSLPVPLTPRVWTSGSRTEAPQTVVGRHPIYGHMFMEGGE